MESMRKKWRNMPVRRAFIGSVCIALGAAFLLSVGTIAAGLAFQKWLLPEREALYLNIGISYSDNTEEFSVFCMQPGENVLHISTDEMWTIMEDAKNEIPRMIIGSQNSNSAEKKIENIEVSLDRIETSYTALTPKRKIAYMGTSAAMVILPMFYAFLGIILCAMIFFRKKLNPPIEVLSEATEHIRENDLDFTVAYDSSDEFGELCVSFETMRSALEKNNRKLWNMLEDRRILQASVAHDLRNPIAVILGYTEYLQMHLTDTDSRTKQAGKTVSNIEKAARRLERYTDSIRDINQLEEMELNPTDCMLPDLLNDMAEDFRLIAEQRNLFFDTAISGGIPRQRVSMDAQITYRILENVITNALRYARCRIRMECSLDDRILRVVIGDDGEGFPEEILSRQKGTMILGTGEHMGMGLSICQILCRKHGGGMELRNKTPQGAEVIVTLLVSETKSGALTGF